MADWIKRLFTYPEISQLSVDDPRTTVLRKEVIRNNRFLFLVYDEWYRTIKNHLINSSDVLEIGSGAGFFKDYLPGAITSDVFELPGVDLVIDAQTLPVMSRSLDAIVMTNVFHHIPDVELFLREATRCLRSSGRLVMIEPWRTAWSQWIYQSLHSEPFVPDAGWQIPGGGPLSTANGALPWIIFERDRVVFEAKYSSLRIVKVQPLMPMAYIISGGMTIRGLIPSCAYRPVRTLERTLFERLWSMFALIIIEKE